MKIEKSIYKDEPVITFVSDGGHRILTLGTYKARVILENITEIRKFLKKNKKKKTK